MQIKILIIEDEAIVAWNLELLLQNFGYEVTGTADNARHGLQLFHQHAPDLVLLDINIQGDHDGIHLAEQMKMVRELPIIFLTAMTDTDYLQRAKSINPAAYLIKPFQEKGLQMAIELAISNFAFQRTAATPQPFSVVHKKSGDDEPASAQTRLNNDALLIQDQFIFLKNKSHFVKVPISDLLYLKTEDNYTLVFTNLGKFIIRLQLHQILEKLSGFPALVRTHRSYSVNINNISSFNDEEIMVGAQSLPLGRSYKKDFLQVFKFV